MGDAGSQSTALFAAANALFIPKMRAVSPQG